MRNNILTYNQMCNLESTSSLQKGMNFRFRGLYSILLMSVRKNSPYNDRVEEEGKVLIYEGHDASKDLSLFPKEVDQPMVLKSGNLTENGKFYQAAAKFKKGRAPPEKVRVYEKIKPGIWSDNGFFHLVDSWMESSGSRKVFKFQLKATDFKSNHKYEPSFESTRVIPTEVKVEVWSRDKGVCTQCGAKDELHFDHIIPFSKGGTSLKAENIQLLCARHNLSKNNKIL